MPPDTDVSDVPEPVIHHSHLPWQLLSLLCTAFWIWMCVDCYRRRQGLDNWHYLFFFFPPSTALYFVAHIRQIMSSGFTGNGLFGLGLKGKIKRAQQNLLVSNTLAARIELAELYFQAKDFANCENEFRNVLQQEPNYLEAFYYTGLCRLQAGDATGALENLKVVMERDKKLRFGIAWLRYTDCLAATGQRDQALEERRKLSRAFPRPLTEFPYAELLAESGQKEKAREVLEEMLATSFQAPKEDRQWLSRGKALLRQVK